MRKKSRKAEIFRKKRKTWQPCLQRSETNNPRHQMSAKQYAMDISASPSVTNLVESRGQNLNYAQIQSSSTSAQFIYNQISTRLNSRH